MDDAAVTELRFVEDISLDDYRMFEMESSLVEELSVGDTLTPLQLRGSPDAKAVLVSQTKSFLVRLVESSNTQLLVSPATHSSDLTLNPSLEAALALSETSSSSSSSSKEGTDDQPTAKRRKEAQGAGKEGEGGEDGAEEAKVEERNVRQIAGMFSCHYELVEVQPALQLLRDLLFEHPYDGQVDEEAMLGAQGTGDSQDAVVPKAGLYSIQALHKLVQASDTELYRGLEDLDAIEIDGFWRVLDPDYAADVNEMILNVVMEKDWPLDNLSAEAIAEECRADHPPEIVTHCLRALSLKQEPEQDTDVFKVDNDKVCLFRATQLLAEKDPYPHDEFVATWEDVTPYGVTPSTEMLRGHALLSESTVNGRPMKVWNSLEEHSLASDAKQRFAQLFTIRARWELQDIEPYLTPVTAPKQNLKQLLLRHCRAVREGKNVVYTKR